MARFQEPCHVLYCNYVRPCLAVPQRKVAPVVQGVDFLTLAKKVTGETQTHFRDFPALSHSIDGQLHLPQVVEAIEYAKDIHAIFGSQFTGFDDDVVGVRLVAKPV